MSEVADGPEISVSGARRRRHRRGRIRDRASTDNDVAGGHHADVQVGDERQRPTALAGAASSTMVPVSAMAAAQPVMTPSSPSSTATSGSGSVRSGRQPAAGQVGRHRQPAGAMLGADRRDRGRRPPPARPRARWHGIRRRARRTGRPDRRPRPALAPAGARRAGGGRPARPAPAPAPLHVPRPHAPPLPQALLRDVGSSRAIASSPPPRSSYPGSTRRGPAPGSPSRHGRAHGSGGASRNTQASVRIARPLAPRGLGLADLPAQVDQHRGDVDLDRADLVAGAAQAWRRTAASRRGPRCPSAAG